MLPYTCYALFGLDNFARAEKSQEEVQVEVPIGYQDLRCGKINVRLRDELWWDDGTIGIGAPHYSLQKVVSG